MNFIPESELIIRPGGQIYHLNLLPEQIAYTIILVGDQDRVSFISSYFDTIEHKVQSREFVTHTGYLNGKHLSVLSTGIGTDNIDIVLNELDALVNINFQSRTPNNEHKSLTLIRIGTTGALQEYLDVDKPVYSKFSIGFDGLLNFYADRDKVTLVDMEKAFVDFTQWNNRWAAPYFVKSADSLFNKLIGNANFGITISAPGFYGPQGRVLRMPLMEPQLNELLADFDFNGLKITNYEMESSALYGLSLLLGHEALTVCNVIANRKKKQYSKDYQASLKIIIEDVLARLTE
jgi:uridine phosphorylase